MKVFTRRTLQRGTAHSAAAPAAKARGKGVKRARDVRADEEEGGDGEAKALALATAALEHLPANVKVAAEYLRLKAKAVMSQVCILKSQLYSHFR